MERSQIKKEILNMLIERKARISPEEMSDNIDIRNDIDLDSIQILEIIGDIEDRFDIEIPDRKLRELKTVGNIITFIEENQ
jgi:acyl carrier protein